MTNEQHAKDITARIVEAIRTQRILPWQQPWVVEGGTHRSFHGLKPYRGVNQFLLDITAMVNGYEHPVWITAAAAKKESGKLAAADKEAGRKPEWKGVQKGEKGTRVYLWKPIPKKEDGELVKDDNGEQVYIWLLRCFTVFNAEQTRLDIPRPTKAEAREADRIEAAAALIEGCPDPPDIQHGGDTACYIPALDTIRLPEQRQFTSDEAYYSTAFHELIHATGHAKRTGRLTGEALASFGSDPYAKEELVAEIGANILRRVAGINDPDLDNNSDAYVDHWAKRFEENERLLMSAGSAAQTAADYVTATTYDN